MDPEIVRAAEAEMRRPAPDDNPSKRQKTEISQAGTAGVEFDEVARYEYDGATSLEAGASGFIVTCNFRKEKSATREANTALLGYLRKLSTEGEAPANPAVPIAASPAKAELEVGGTGSLEAAEIEPKLSGTKRKEPPPADLSSLIDEESPELESAADAQIEDLREKSGSRLLSVIKVACRGVIVLRLLTSEGLNPCDVIASLLQDVEQKSIPAFLHCQRIIPVQLTCLLEPELLKAAASKVAKAYASRQAGALGATGEVKEGIAPRLKYAVYYTFRGIGEDNKAKSEQGMRRAVAIPLLAAAFAEALGEERVAVDLVKPDVVLLAEVLPIGGKLFCGLSVLDSGLTITTPRIQVKPLLS